MLTSSDIKRALREAGLVVYRTQDHAVFVAERVRENLILDSGVRVSLAPLSVTFLAEAPRSVFPGDGVETLFERARALAQPALARGFVETATIVAKVEDPSDPVAILDERYQVAFAKEVDGLETALVEVRFALSLTRHAER